MVFKLLRIAILLLILGSVASTLIIQRNIVHNWQGTKDIRIIPIALDSAIETENYISQLKKSDFSEISTYLKSQAKKYGIDLSHGLAIQLMPALSTSPPPQNPSLDATRIDILFWSLSLKWWAWQNQLDDHHDSQIRLYVMYQNPEIGQTIAHSTGLRNGLIGLINARVRGRPKHFHNVIITHELLHIFGARDKYNLQNGSPNFPHGYANPNQKPLFPQGKTEIMARAKPINKNEYEVAMRLSKTVIGQRTATEIGWLKYD